MALNPTKICIIGHGVGGYHLTVSLVKQNNPNIAITVISTTRYFETPFSLTGYLAEPNDEGKNNPHFEPFVNGAKYVIGKVKTMSDSHAELESGEQVDFDMAVICTGVNIPFFADDERAVDVQDRKAQIKAKWKDIESSTNIVISGGGPISCETAADIKLRNKNKNIKLIIPRDQVLEKMGPQFSIRATEHLKKIGIDLITGNKVVKVSEGFVETSDGSKVPADVYIPCHATKPNSEFVPASSLNVYKYIKTNPFFEVVGMKNVFAVGDCAEFSNKGAFSAMAQVDFLLGNIKRKLEGQTMKEWQVPSFWVEGPIMVALGHHVPDSYGIGPNLPWPCPGFLTWFCCCCGWPCSNTSSGSVGKIKSDWSVTAMTDLKKGTTIQRI